jgi:CBS domain-containing protein
MRVGEFCTRDVVVVRKESAVNEAVRLMREHQVANPVVVEEKDGRRVPIGMLTDRDIVSRVITEALHDLPALAVGDIMNTNLMTTNEDQGLSDALRGMYSHGIRRAPVVNGSGSLEGILSVDDLVDRVCEELGEMTMLLALHQRRQNNRECGNGHGIGGS